MHFLQDRLSIRQFKRRKISLALTADLVFHTTERYRPSLSYYTSTSRVHFAARDRPTLGRRVATTEETSPVDDRLYHLRATASLNSRVCNALFVLADVRIPVSTHPLLPRRVSRLPCSTDPSIIRIKLRFGV